LLLPDVPTTSIPSSSPVAFFSSTAPMLGASPFDAHLATLPSGRSSVSSDTHHDLPSTAVLTTFSAALLQPAVSYSSASEFVPTVKHQTHTPPPPPSSGAGGNSDAAQRASVSVAADATAGYGELLPGAKGRRWKRTL
jgi:hypothetical protein